MNKIIGIHEKLPIGKTLPLSFQHLFAMFGATIVVPLMFGVNPAIVLLMNGIGTILYSIVTKGGIPAYLGSSFAFIVPTLMVMKKFGDGTYPSGFDYAQGGFIAFGVFFVIMSIIIKYFGIKWIDIVFPPAVMGAVVAVIGFELAPSAARNAGLLAWPTKVGDVVQNFTMDPKTVAVALITLFAGIIGTVVLRRFMKIIPILIAVVIGYVAAIIFGLVTPADLHAIIAKPFVAFPSLSAPKFNWTAILTIAPAFIVVLAEHISHLIVTGNITEEDLIKKPGLHLSLLGDGIANIISGFAGSPPNTTYGENIGVMAITRVYSVWVIRGAAIIAIIFSCLGWVAAFIETIPAPVIGGISLVLYGVISASGIRMLVEKRVDFSKGYNLILAAVTFIVGVSGASISLGSQVPLSGMSLSAVVGVLLSLIFFIISKLGLMNEKYEPAKPAPLVDAPITDTINALD